MSFIMGKNTAVDGKEFDQVVTSTVLAMRRSLGVTTAELAKASGIPRSSIEAIERGGTSTSAERHDIATAVGWLSNHNTAQRLTGLPSVP
ncbi:MAG: helix-turn-helix transcriptional regulator [Actinomycetota bacterium]